MKKAVPCPGTALRGVCLLPLLVILAGITAGILAVVPAGIVLIRILAAVVLAGILIVVAAGIVLAGILAAVPAVSAVVHIIVVVSHGPYLLKKGH